MSAFSDRRFKKTTPQPPPPTQETFPTSGQHRRTETRRNGGRGGERLPNTTMNEEKKENPTKLHPRDIRACRTPFLFVSELGAQEPRVDTTRTHPSLVRRSSFQHHQRTRCNRCNGPLTPHLPHHPQNRTHHLIRSKQNGEPHLPAALTRVPPATPLRHHASARRNDVAIRKVFL